MTRPGWHREFSRPAYWPVADWEYTPERTSRELEYLAARLPAGTRLLDAGCGLGRHAVGLAARGWQVTGIDCRTDVLAQARDRARRAGAPLARFVCADLFDGPALRENSLGAVICLQAFGWGDDADQHALLDGLRRMLVPGGTLILDVTNPVWIFANYQPAAVTRIGGTEYRFERRYDLVSGRSRGSVIAAGLPGGRVSHDIRLYTAPEAGRLLTNAGFAVEAVDGDFAVDGPAGLRSRYLQFVARRIGPS
jgi:SAM-dependent methyltransferase